MVWFEVKDAKTSATRNQWRTGRIPHDRRRTLRTRKSAESEHRLGGAVGDRARSRQCGLTEVSPFVIGTQQGWLGDTVASANPTDSSLVQKSTPLKEMWLQESAADSPSGKTSPHTWHGSPHPSGSSKQRQTMRSQYVATNVIQPTTASTIKSFSLLFLLISANYTISRPSPSNHLDSSSQQPLVHLCVTSGETAEDDFHLRPRRSAALPLCVLLIRRSTKRRGGCC